jgi:DNA replication and repair protein RecF
VLVRRLSLTDFRNYSTAEVILEPGPNLFIGNNGQGKTNLVEALGYLSTLGSHRVSTDQALIKNTAQSAIIRAQLEHETREVLVELQINRSEPNRAQVNRSTVKLREVPRYFSVFCLPDLFLFGVNPLRRISRPITVHTPRIASGE